MAVLPLTMILAACGSGSAETANQPTACEQAVIAITDHESKMAQTIESMQEDWEAPGGGSSHLESWMDGDQALDDHIRAEMRDEFVFWANMVLEAPEGCLGVETLATARGVLGQ